MSTTIATSEASSRPSSRTVARPCDGQLLKVKLSTPLLIEYDAIKDRLYDLTSKNLSQTILMRRALSLYLRQVAKLNDEQVIQEAQNLMAHR
jgi:hypothetical protein